MSKKKVFISSRIQEMSDVREAAIKGIVQAGMEPLYFDSTDPQRRWPLKPGVSLILQLLEGVENLRCFRGSLRLHSQY